jgi:uncharacterized protein
MDEIINQFKSQASERLKKHLLKIILFGSRARGDGWEWSDYDFAVIVDNKTKKIESIIDDISGDLFYKHSKLIGPVIWSAVEWEENKKYPIGINILKEGIEL